MLELGCIQSLPDSCYHPIHHPTRRDQVGSGFSMRNDDPSQYF